MIKPATLDALSQLPDDSAERAACTIVAHFFGAEYGIEYVPAPDREAAYVNRGDAYHTTLLRDDTGWHVTSWGDWLEAAEERYAEESGETRCPNCGEWTEWVAEERDCAACDGTGGEDEAACPACDGSGRLPDPDLTCCAACGYAD